MGRGGGGGGGRSLSCLSGKVAKSIYTEKSAAKLWVGPPIAPSQSRALRSTSAPLPLRSPRLHLSVAREVCEVGWGGGRHPLWAMCPALWIHLDDNHKKRKTINDINNYYYNKKITSPTNNLPRSTSQKWKKLKLILKKQNKNKTKSLRQRAEQWFGIHHDGGLEDQVWPTGTGNSSLLLRPAGDLICFHQARSWVFFFCFISLPCFSFFFFF